jgi:hypothetical protein
MFNGPIGLVTALLVTLVLSTGWLMFPVFADSWDGTFEGLVLRRPVSPAQRLVRSLRRCLNRPVGRNQTAYGLWQPRVERFVGGWSTLDWEASDAFRSNLSTNPAYRDDLVRSCRTLARAACRGGQAAAMLAAVDLGISRLPAAWRPRWEDATIAAVAALVLKDTVDDSVVATCCRPFQKSIPSATLPQEWWT